MTASRPAPQRKPCPGTVATSPGWCPTWRRRARGSRGWVQADQHGAVGPDFGRLARRRAAVPAPDRGASAQRRHRHHARPPGRAARGRRPPARITRGAHGRPTALARAIAESDGRARLGTADERLPGPPHAARTGSSPRAPRRGCPASSASAVGSARSASRPRRCRRPGVLGDQAAVAGRTLPGARGSSHPPRSANQCGEVKRLYVTTGAIPAARQRSMIAR